MLHRLRETWHPTSPQALQIAWRGDKFREHRESVSELPSKGASSMTRRIVHEDGKFRIVAAEGKQYYFVEYMGKDSMGEPVWFPNGYLDEEGGTTISAQVLAQLVFALVPRP